MKAEYAITVADRLVTRLTTFASELGLAESAVNCLCDARTLRDLIAEELNKRKVWNTNRDARQHAAGRKKGKNGGLGRGRKSQRNS